MSSRYALKAKPLRGGLRPALTARAVMASLRLREWLRGDERGRSRVFQRREKTMIREFVGFEAYEAACEGDTGLLGWSPVDTALWLKISMRDVLRAVQDGVLDLCRVIRCDGSVQLLVSLASIRAFRWPYEVEAWKPHRKRRHLRRPRRWQLLMLEADQQRGAWQFGMSGTY